MLKLTLKDSSVLECADGIKAYEAAAQISEGLSRAALAVKLEAGVKITNVSVLKSTR